MRYLFVLLLAGCAAFAGLSYAQHRDPNNQPGRFSIVAADGIAWRLDTATGTVVACFPAKIVPATGQVVQAAGCDPMTK